MHKVKKNMKRYPHSFFFLYFPNTRPTQDLRHSRVSYQDIEATESRI